MHNAHLGFSFLRRWFVRLFLFTFLTTCCFLSGVWAYIPPLRAWAFNHVTVTHGQVELLAGLPPWRERLPGRANLSPDGRRVIFPWAAGEQRDYVVWNLETGQQQPFGLVPTATCWISETTVLVHDYRHNRYTLVDVRTRAAVPVAEYIDPAQRLPGGKRELLTRWQRAERVYVIEDFDVSGPTVLSMEQGQAAVYYGLGVPQDAAFSLEVPHTSIPRSARRIGIATNEKISSPDERFVVTIISFGSDEHVQILDRDGTVVAEMSKHRWGPYVWGWAPDSSGVYLNMGPLGAAVTPDNEVYPFYKLSPLSPIDEWLRVVGQEGLWTAGAAAVWALGQWRAIRHAARRARAREA